MEESYIIRLCNIIRVMMTTMKWVCNNCNSIMDKTNFTEFIKQSDNDKNSNQEARVQYHSWRLLPAQCQVNVEL
jgi:hypothetical protein